MLAEIFMVRLEARARLSQETTPASNSQFAPLLPTRFNRAKKPRDIKGLDRRTGRVVPDDV
jgi:hypothetical protein